MRPFFMLKKLATIAAACMLSAPAMAVNPEGVRYDSLDSLGCMMLQDCTEGVDKIETYEDLVKLFPDSDYSKYQEEIERLLVALKAVNIEVFVSDDRYFPPQHRGIYDVGENNFFLNRDYVWDEVHLIQVMRHEGWHAAQDCMAGTLDNTFTAVILQDGTVPQYIQDVVARTYPPQPRPWENEAFYAATQPGLTVEALNACAAPKPMWDIYTPTPMTREWLVNQGYIK